MHPNPFGLELRSKPSPGGGRDGLDLLSGEERGGSNGDPIVTDERRRPGGKASPPLRGRPGKADHGHLRDWVWTLGLSPVDLPEPLAPPPHALRWTSLVILVAALLLALLNAHAIRGWANQLPPGHWSARASTAADAWYDSVGGLGLNRPVAALHERWKSLKALRFPGQEAGASRPRSDRENASNATG